MLQIALKFGTVSQGFTVEEALSNLKEATEIYLEEFPLEDVQRSLLTTFDIEIKRSDLLLIRNVLHE
jgi:hypothetical protein